MIYNLSTLSTKYDKGIKDKCENIRMKLINCIRDNFNDKFICDSEINSFNQCIQQFDVEFREKFKLNKKNY